MTELALAVVKELWSAFYGAVGPVAMIGLLGWMFREKWKQMLSRSLGLDLEREKARALRELEGYKVSLIAEAERHKAKVELRKVIAVKHTTQEYDALVALYDLLMTATSTICTRATLAPAQNLESEALAKQFQVALNAHEKFDQAVGRANLFLGLEVGLSCFAHSGELFQVSCDHLMKSGAAPIAEETKGKLLERGAKLRSLVKRRIDELVRIVEKD
jgi:hypothetical protein